MANLPNDLFQRVSGRANDPMRRTAMSGAQANATPLDMGQLMADFQKHAPPQAQGLLGALGNLQSMLGANMPGFAMMGPGGMMSIGMPTGPQPLAQAPAEQALKEAEAAIGRPLPEEVRQLYAIGDGGFGPGEGLFPLAELVERYRDLTDEPYGPLGQDWPKNLLPLFDENPALGCIDLDSGEIVAWDPEEIEDEDSDEDWQRSFKPEHPNLAALLQQWLGEETVEELMQREMTAAQDKMADEWIERLEKQSEAARAGHGFTGPDWREQVRRRCRGEG
ncbi:MAG: SMI1/KNR4 family protein [Pseudomonadota bacterium]|nr:SMI1/KNR4 family protein [Pseudomonadota bacterium]